MDGKDLASCHNWWVRLRNCACNTLGNKSTKKVPRREVESFFREERNVTTGLVSFTHHRIQIITILAGTDIAKKTFKNLIHSGGMMLSYEEAGVHLKTA